ncbi:MAG: beta-ketoacyl synthase N-terminal-like domain-containing protein [Xenococcaceae cyanobacterium]
MKDSDYKSLMKEALRELKERKAQILAKESAEREAIAIVGMGCRFPGGADSPEAFWQLLLAGVDAITELPPERWDLDAYYDPNPNVPGKMYVQRGGFVEQLKEFDAEFFGISPREAVSMDPQQRLLLEVTWFALAHAAIVPEKLLDSQTGTFIGICSNDYWANLLTGDPKQIDAYMATGNSHSVASGRLSYILGLTGPSIAVDTACSSSLVAVHLACQSLRNGECNLAIAGGVNRILTPEPNINFSKARMLSPDGLCKTFAASANGYVRGEGCGIIILKRLSLAIADGDNILALIRGSAVNSDGSSGGLTVPNAASQQAVIRQALSNSGVEPDGIGYIEAHGTGTELGDPIEVRSLAAVFGKNHSQNNPLVIGSAKTNIGHLEAAAGIAGLIKTVLILQHEKIPPHLHFHTPSPHIDWEEIPVKVPTSSMSWSRGEKSRLAGVSSFGFSGTNAHVVLEEAPFQGKRHLRQQRRAASAGAKPSLKAKGKRDNLQERPLHLLTLSAKTEKALSELVGSYQTYLETHRELEIADICYTANAGRSHFNHRLAAIASSKQELAEKLSKVTAGEEVPGVFTGKITNSTNTPKVAFLFTGQGSQYVNMGRELYETQSVFRAAIEECDRILGSVLDPSITEVLYGINTEAEDYVGGFAQLRTSVYAQPALFAIEYALVQLWQSWGIKPDVVMGHSLGEYVAATVAGVFSLEDGLKLIARRGQLMQQLPSGGKMVAAIASEEKVRELITPYTDKVSIAAINGPESVVISGISEAIEAICSRLELEQIKTKELEVSHAFHSPLMSPMLAEFEAAAKQITYHQPQIPLISNVTGLLADNSITTAEYWVNHVRQPVRFAQSMETLLEFGYEVFLEVGPKPILLGMGRQCLPEDRGVWLPSLRPTTFQAPEFIGENNPKSKIQIASPHSSARNDTFEEWGCCNPKSNDWQEMLSSLGQLYLQGVKIDWSGFDENYIRQKVVLPAYPFQRQSYWIEKKGATVNERGNWEHQSQSKEHPLLGYRLKNLAHLPDIYIWETEVDEGFLSYLKDNRALGTAIVPHTAYIEMGLAAAEKALAVECNSITDLKIHHPFFLSDAGNQKIQVVLSPELDNLMSLNVYGCRINKKSIKPTWTLYATAKIHLENK